MKAWLSDKFRTIPSAWPPNGRVFGDLVPAEMQAWAEGERFGADRPLSLVVVGPSRLGKTEWARSLGPHVYMNGQFAFDDVPANTEYAVVDDCGWLRWKRELKPWLGAQHEVTIRKLYRGMVTVHWGRPCIVLCNHLSASVRRDAWFIANTIVVDLTARLY